MSGKQNDFDNTESMVLCCPGAECVSGQHFQISRIGGCPLNAFCVDINTVFYSGIKPLNPIDFEISVVIVC
jgi:hypothetical protein